MTGWEQEPDGEELLYTILEEVADADGVDPMDLPPLGETVDVDAVLALGSGPQDVLVSFEYAGYHVTLGSDGSIMLAASDRGQDAVATDRSEEFRV